MFTLEPIETETLSLNKRSVVNDVKVLKKIKKTCFTSDSRACWIGGGLPFTSVKEFLPFSNWSTEHWAMYDGFLRDIDDDSKPKNVLDVGCGCGHATACLSSIYNNWDILAIDIDPICLNLAKEFNHSDKISYQLADFMKFDLDKKYDYIFVLEVLEHVSPADHYILMDKCLSSLDDGGMLFITTPNENTDNTGKTKANSGGHIGILNNDLAPKFYNRYKDNLVCEGFYDNAQLSSCDRNKFIVDEPFDSFKSTDRNRSHFKFTFKKE